jgi:hypothetical protein
MNLKKIMDKYTKGSLIDELVNLYPKEKRSYTGYDYIIDKLKSYKPMKTSIILHIDMSLKDGKDSYEVYGINDQDEYVDLSFVAWDVWMSMEIEPEILEYMDEKIVFAHCLYTLAMHGFNEGPSLKPGLDISEFVSSFFGDASNHVVVKTMDIQDFLNELNEVTGELMQSLDFEDIGTFEVESNEIAIYDAEDVNDKVVLPGVKAGTWHATAVNYTEETREDGKPDYIEFTVKHDDVAQKDIYRIEATTCLERHDLTLDIKSKKFIIKDNKYFNELEIIKSDVDPKVIDNGVVGTVGKDNGPFTVFKYYSKDNELIAIRFILTDEIEEDDEIF